MLRRGVPEKGEKASMELQKYDSVCSEYSTYLQAEKGMAPATCESYLQAVETCFAVVRARPADLLLPENWDWPDLDKRSIEIYLNHLLHQRGWKPSSVRQQMSALRVFFRFLQSKGYARRNPLKTIVPPPPAPPGPLPEGEQAAVQKLFALPGATLTQARLLTLLELIYGGGMRPSQVYRIAAIRPRPKEGTIRVAVGEVSHQITLSEAGMDRVRLYLGKRKEALQKKRPRPFWVGERGARVGVPQLARAVKQAMEGAGLPGGGRVLRQLSARHFRERGGDVRSLREFLGAKRLGTLDRYGAPDFQEVQAEFRRLHPRGGEGES